MTEIKRYAAVIGHPIAHSLSPRIHRAAARFLGLKEEYAACDIAPDGLEDFVSKLRKDERLKGLSVTMPHKRSMVRFVEDASEEVERLSLLNTVVVDDGRWKGYNTDIAGIVRALGWGRRFSPKFAPLTQPEGEGALHLPNRPRFANWLVLGAGATALSTIEAAGLLRAKRIAFAVRNPSRAFEATAYAEEIDLEVTSTKRLNTQEAVEGIKDFGVIVSTVPVGAADFFASALQKHKPDLTGKILLDVVYDPWPSRLGLAARSLGATVLGGKCMLLFQAIEQIRLFFPEETRFYGHDPQKAQDFEAYVAEAVGMELVKR